MCGIFGFFGSLQKNTALECVHSLEHRGPDGYGLWQTSDITLGHRRLKILDLSERSKQPMSYADERYWITFNGEIYNFLELRKELEGKGHRFQSDSDTEVVLAAFAEWGEACLPKFNGMWAFAIWDRVQKKLFFSRDRFGKKPLFYGKFKSGFGFASEMKALFPLMDEVKPNIPLVTAMHRLYTYESSPECVIEGIQRFPAGHFGWLENGEMKLKRWWCTLDHVPQVSSRFEDQVEQFRELFLDSCKLRMRSDVPIGTALSGGLDSSATISVMAHITKTGAEKRFNHQNLNAFVSSYPGSPFDESHFAQKVIDHTGVKGHIIQIDPVKALDQLEKFYYLFEELYITSPIPFMITYGAIKKAGISVTLDGHGGDELFCGYVSDQLAALRDAGWHIPRAMGVISTYINSFPKDSPQFPKFSSKWKFFLDSRKQYMHQLKTGQLEQVRSIDENHLRWLEMEHVNRRLYAHTHDTTLPTLLRNYDRLSMSNGVEIRMPFLDHRLVSFAFALPWTSKLRNGYSRAVVRKAVADYMPHEIAFRKTKIGWSSPILDWMKGPLKPFISDLVASKSFHHCDLVDAKTVSTRVHQLIQDPNAKYDDAQNVWTMLTPYLWENAVIKNWKSFAKSSTSSPEISSVNTQTSPQPNPI